MHGDRNGLLVEAVQERREPVVLSISRSAEGKNWNTRLPSWLLKLDKWPAPSPAIKTGKTTSTVVPSRIATASAVAPPPKSRSAE